MKDPKLTGNQCLCRDCGYVFSTAGNFDRHRRGKTTNRYCENPAEMGLVLSKQGVWKLPGFDRRTW